MNATCHCGKVNVTISRRPDYINFCDCSLCRKMGGAWGYFQADQVEVVGQTAAYRREDYDKPAVEMRRCTQCGSVTHWTLTEHYPGDRIGVNMRLFLPSELDGIEARTLDGHNWNGDTEPQLRRPNGVVGHDVFI